MSSDAIINKYRPQAFDEVLGHGATVEALRKAIAAPTRPHTFLLTGPSGVGKTTLARIIGRELECTVEEIDAASNSGVDEISRLVDMVAFRSFEGNGDKLVIIDEAHTISKQGWQKLLKVAEEPPEHLYFAFCTTELHKVPDTIQTRCYKVVLHEVGRSALEELLELVCDVEEWEVNGNVAKAVLQAAQGSPRRLLSVLQAVHDVESADEVNRIIGLMHDDSGPVAVVKMLMASKKDWPMIAAALADIEREDYREAMVQAVGYIAQAMLTSKTGLQQWGPLLEAFTFPAASYDPKVQFVAAVARYLGG